MNGTSATFVTKKHLAVAMHLHMYIPTHVCVYFRKMC